jgi:hypothetical protein
VNIDLAQLCHVESDDNALSSWKCPLYLIGDMHSKLAILKSSSHVTEFLEVSPIEVCSVIYGSTACQESLYSTGKQASPGAPTYIAIRTLRKAALGIRNIITNSLEGWGGSTSFTFYRETSHNESSRAQQKSCFPA